MFTTVRYFYSPHYLSINTAYSKDVSRRSDLLRRSLSTWKTLGGRKANVLANFRDHALPLNPSQVATVPWVLYGDSIALTLILVGMLHPGGADKNIFHLGTGFFHPLFSVQAKGVGKTPAILPWPMYGRYIELEEAARYPEFGRTWSPTHHNKVI